MKGKIIKGIAGFYYIYAEDGNTYECKAKGIFRKDKIKPLVGDDAEIEILDVREMEGNITALLPRRNSLIRPAVANVDQALVIFAADKPRPNLMLLDKFLIMMDRQDIPTILCFNKKDLDRENTLMELVDIYRSCGYQVLCTSTVEDSGIQSIRDVIRGTTTVVAGPSGVGKSSITNMLQANVTMETGEISQKLKRGKHTTRHSQIIPVEKDTFFVDTPGFSSLYTIDMDESELRFCFPEFRQYENECRFQGCRHIHEPDCKVKEALRQNKISSRRYENYLAIYQELAEKRRF